MIQVSRAEQLCSGTAGQQMLPLSKTVTIANGKSWTLENGLTWYAKNNDKTAMGKVWNVAAV